MAERFRLLILAAAFTDSAGVKGAMLRRGNSHRSVRWADSVRKAGLPEGFRFHELRHTGNHLAALSGATTRELMNRMGHASMRAAC